MRCSSVKLPLNLGIFKIHQGMSIEWFVARQKILKPVSYNDLLTRFPTVFHFWEEQMARKSSVLGLSKNKYLRGLLLGTCSVQLSHSLHLVTVLEVTQMTCGVLCYKGSIHWFLHAVNLRKKDKLLIYCRITLNKNWKLKLVVIFFTTVVIINSS